LYRLFIRDGHLAGVMVTESDDHGNVRMIPQQLLGTRTADETENGAE
jgi:hypothetical protein